MDRLLSYEEKEGEQQKRKTHVTEERGRRSGAPERERDGEREREREEEEADARRTTKERGERRERGG